MKKLYIVRKYIVADSIADAIKRESKIPPDDIWMEESTSKDHATELLKPHKERPFNGLNPQNI